MIIYPVHYAIYYKYYKESCKILNKMYFEGEIFMQCKGKVAFIFSHNCKCLPLFSV